MTFDRDTLIALDMLTVALVEIRASDQLQKSAALADVFHNIPARIARGFSGDELLEEMELRASRNGCSDYMQQLRQHVASKIKSLTG